MSTVASFLIRPARHSDAAASGDDDRPTLSPAGGADDLATTNMTSVPWLE